MDQSPLTVLPRTYSADEYRELGTKYFQRKEYDKAVLAFSDAIELSNPPTVKLFEYRALAYQNAGNHDSAIRDGRNMIKTNRTDPRGYLRTTRILIALGRDKAALDVCKLGLRNVSVADEKFPTLQKIVDELTRKLSPPKAVDPFTQLPPELAESILEYLNFRDYVKCLRVSKQWKKFLTSPHRYKFWTHLDLSLASKNVAPRFVRSCLTYSAGQITRATIHRFHDTSLLRTLTTVCKNLEELKFLSGPLLSDSILEMAQCARNLQKFIYDADVTFSTVTRFLEFRPTLVHAEFTQIMPSTLSAQWSVPLPALKVLILRVQTGQRGNDYNHGELLTKAPNLEVLELKGMKSVPPLLPTNTPESWDFTSVPLKELRLVHYLNVDVPVLPTLVREFVYHPLNFHTGTPERINFHALQSDLPNITTLRLHGLMYLSSTFLTLLLMKRRPEGASEADVWMAVANASRSLEALDRLPNIDVSEYTALTALALEDYLPDEETSLQTFLSVPRIGTPALKSLSLSKIPFGDDDLECVPALAPGLTDLVLSRTAVTGYGVKRLVDKLESLRTLELEHCEGITSTDVIEYARRKGVRVKYNLGRPAPLLGGRRVRMG